MDGKGIFLTHFITPDTPGYGGTRSFEKELASSIKEGNSSNSSLIRFNSHFGTHIDLPFHFSDSGKKLEHYPADFWLFENACVWERTSAADEIISPDDTLTKSVRENCDLLLIRTGFERHRGSELYWKNNPGISPELAHWLRKHRKQVRVIGFDMISLTGFQSRTLGRQAHLAFLAPDNHEEPILIIEDMKLSELKHPPQKVLVSPLLIQGADGGPVTVFAW